MCFVLQTGIMLRKYFHKYELSYCLSPYPVRIIRTLGSLRALLRSILYAIVSTEGPKRRAPPFAKTRAGLWSDWSRPAEYWKNASETRGGACSTALVDLEPPTRLGYG